MKSIVALAALLGFLLGAGLSGIEPAGAESTVGQSLNTFCPQGTTAAPTGFIHDDDLQKVLWVYTCIGEGGAGAAAVPR